MNYNVLTALLIYCLSFTASAQSDSTASVSPFVSLHAGTLMGKPGKGTSLSLTLTPGLRLNRVAIVVGSGYDTYATWRTLPVFAGVGYDFLKRPDYVFFVQFHTGYSKAWNIRTGDFNPQYKNEGGYFYHPFIGCRLAHGKAKIYFTAGYKFQNLTYEEVPRPTWGGGQVRKTVVADMQRFSVQIGIGI